MALEIKELKVAAEDKKEVAKFVPVSLDTTYKIQEQQEKQNANSIIESLQQGAHIDEYLKNSSDIKALSKVLNITLRKPTLEERRNHVLGANTVLAIDNGTGEVKFKAIIPEDREDQAKNMYAIIEAGLKDIGTKITHKKIESAKMGSQTYEISISRSLIVGDEVTKVNISFPVGMTLQTFEQGFLWAIINQDGFAGALKLIYR